MQINDQAPEFEALDQDGNTVKLSDYKGRKVVLYFYPRDNTPGCTAQACNLKDNYELLQKQGYEVLGVSSDGEKSHKKFIDKFELPFKLLVDSDQTIQKLYDAWGEKKMYGKTYMGTLRKTYIINEEGKIDDIIEKVKTKAHTEQIIN
jgi:peroxiredoxin Q/BCP